MDILADAEGPAAFRRLCVETRPSLAGSVSTIPAAFRRLCVETGALRLTNLLIDPAAFRRLCVETIFFAFAAVTFAQPPLGGCVLKHLIGCNRVCCQFPAAFRRLFVETPLSHL